jgi:CRISPR-associated protein Cas1
VPDEALLDLVTSFLLRPVRTGWGLARPERGIPQGGPLSPLLANVVLDRFDRALLADGFPVVRYGDDIAIAAGSAGEANAALAAAADAADDAGLELGSDKTEVTSFESGFFFLGEEFNARYPPDDPTARRDEPDRRTLYVGVQGAGVRVEAGRVLVERDDNELLSVPQGHLARLVLAGSVGLSAGARSWALYSAIDVVFLSRRGSFLGWLEGGGLPNAHQRRAQYLATADGARRVAIGRQVVAGKLANQAALLLRFARRRAPDQVTEATDQVSRYAAELDAASSTDELMGIEGIAARAYYDGFAALLPEGQEFPGRQRHPPPDVINAALSYGYAVLLGEAVSACASAGLDPVAGFLHSDDARRPSLALDLMEEFRPIVVDAAVLELFRRAALDSNDARPDPNRPGVLLTEAARRRLLAALEDRLLTVAHRTPSGVRLTRRRHIYAQASQLARCIADPAAAYEPVRWR